MRILPECVNYYVANNYSVQANLNISQACILDTTPQTHDWKHTLGTHAGNRHWEHTSLFPPTMCLNACQKRLLSTSLIPLLDSMRASPANVGISHPSLPNSFVLVGAVAANTKVPPRPQQGGEQITETYLRELTEAECIWRFRYVLVILSHGQFAHEHGWFTLEHGWFMLEHGQFMLEHGQFTLEHGRFTLEHGQFTLEHGWF